MKPSLAVLSDSRGAVFVESLIVLPTLWVFFLCIVQLALLAQADLLVRHAADAAARSASVVLPDDPAEYGGEPRRSVDRGRVDRELLEQALTSLGRIPAGQQSVDSVRGDTTLANFGRSRLNTIRMAAHVPLMPLAPNSLVQSRTPSIDNALPSERSVAAALYYQTFAVAVTFPGEQRGRVLGSEVTVRVTYAYACTIPVARRIVCSARDWLDSAAELDEAALPVLRRFVGGRFRTIRHESTALIHDARYEYRRGDRA